MSIVFKLLKRIVAVFFALIILFVVVILAWRIFSSGNPKSMETLHADRRLADLSESKGEDMYMFRQEQRSITSGEKNYGYFGITDYVIIPEADEIQLTVRYNNSTLRHTAEDFGLDEVPSRDADVYDVTLLLAVDLTPENQDDNLGNDENSVKFIRCHGETVASEQKNLYNFRRLVFTVDGEDANLSELFDKGLLLAIYADFYYVDAVDYESEAYGTLCLYDFKSEDIAVKLQKADRKALEAFE